MDTDECNFSLTCNDFYINHEGRSNCAMFSESESTSDIFSAAPDVGSYCLFCLKVVRLRGGAEMYTAVLLEVCDSSEDGAAVGARVGDDVTAV